jgi:hypothetical protein
VLKHFAALAMCLLARTMVAGQTRTTPTEVNAARFNGTGLGAETNATFAIGLSRDGGSTFEDSARLTDTVTIRGIIRPEPGQLGQRADLFVVDRVNGNFTMRNLDGLFENWTTGRIADLVPYKENQTLTDSIDVDIFTGLLGTSGEHKLFIGYMADDGVLRYTPFPHIIQITEQSAIDQARELFNSTISPNVVQVNCIQCHVQGGIAAGAQHVFVPTTNANHLSVNFSQFQGLLNARGRTFILEMTRGLRGHLGGTVLTSSMQEYKNLDTFLQLLEQAK